MTRKEYLAKRKNLIDEAQQLITDGNSDGADAKMKEVEALDDKWDAIATAQANLEALSKDPIMAFTVSDAFGKEGKEGMNAAKAWESEDYAVAWAKNLLGKSLDENETKVFDLVNNSFKQQIENSGLTTENTSVVIPKTVSAKIWEIAGDEYPYFADVFKTYVPGSFTMIQGDVSSEAKWYDEKTETEDGSETFKEYVLSGCELSRNINISWKLKAMAIEDFLPYITRKLASKMGAALGYGVTHGIGPKVEGKKPEPLGVVSKIKAEDKTPQVVEYDDVPTYDEVIAARGKIASGCAIGLAVYANSSTVWNKLAAIKDNNGRPIFLANSTDGGRPRILGMEVKEDGSMTDGEILISNAKLGYQANINKEMSVMTEEHVKLRNTDICAYAIVDGAPTTNKAHALLTPKAAAASNEQAAG